jgi:hypothetical protein
VLIESGLAASLLLAPPSTAPPKKAAALVVSVTASSDLPTNLVDALLHEAAAVWRAAGVQIMWQPRGASADVRVVIGGGGGHAGDEVLPLGWISFDDDGTPVPMIYLSYTNARMLLIGARDSLGNMEAMPVVQRHTYLSRAMGRALAHELGHYLLGSKLHAEKGLMRARHSSWQFFGPDRDGFRLEADCQDRIAVRFAHQAHTAAP